MLTKSVSADLLAIGLSPVDKVVGVAEVELSSGCWSPRQYSSANMIIEDSYAQEHPTS